MFDESIKNQYEKVYYSLDKTKRFIVFKNSVGSYFYFYEKLIILEDEEIYWYGNYAIWEPDYDNQISFYESIDDLIKDIVLEIKDWIEIK